MKNFRRDAVLTEFNDGYIVHTCDSSGGVGKLTSDIVRVDIRIVAMAALKVAFLENMTLGSKILSVSATFTNSQEYVNLGIEKIKEFLDTRKIPMVISTEKNFQTIQTGVGIGVVGFLKRLRLGGAKSGDGVYVIGIPKVGKEVVEDDGKIAEIRDIERIMKKEEIGEIIPAGSGGIIAEAEILAKNSELNFICEESGEWIKKSAGPATCSVFWARRFRADSKKIKRIGWLE